MRERGSRVRSTQSSALSHRRVKCCFEISSLVTGHFLRAGLSSELVFGAGQRTRGDQAMMLEVIEQNPAAHALYVQQGFRESAHLLSWRRKADAPAIESTALLEEISLIRATKYGARWSILSFPGRSHDMPFLNRPPNALFAAAIRSSSWAIRKLNPSACMPCPVPTEWIGLGCERL